jgi:hypothetical protein
VLEQGKGGSAEDSKSPSKTLSTALGDIDPEYERERDMDVLFPYSASVPLQIDFMLQTIFTVAL